MNLYFFFGKIPNIKKKIKSKLFQIRKINIRNNFRRVVESSLAFVTATDVARCEKQNTALVSPQHPHQSGRSLSSSV